VSDVVVLNHLDVLQERTPEPDVASQVEGVRECVRSLSVFRELEVRKAAEDEGEVRDGSPAAAEVVFCGPCSGGSVDFLAISKALDGFRGAPRHTSARGSCTAVPSMPSPFFALSFGPGASHDASCETACLVLPRGGVRLDGALAMLQALLDGGDAVRIQGYLSFLPARLEPAIASNSAGVPTDDLGLSAFPTSLERSVALPMLAVDGSYRGRLKVRSIESAGVSGQAAERAEISERPWQETSAQAGAEDPGGCKIFICGTMLDEQSLRGQLARTAAIGFQGPLCDLTSLSTSAAQALARREDAVAASLRSVVSAAASGVDGAQISPRRAEAQGIEPYGLDYAEERARAEAYGASLAQSLQAALAPLPPAAAAAAAVVASLAFEMRVQMPGSRGQPAEMVTLRWEHDQVSAWRAPEDPQSGDPRRLQALVVGSQIFCRPVG